MAGANGKFGSGGGTMVRSVVPWTRSLARPFGRLENEMTDLMERFFGPEERWPSGLERVEGFTPSVNLAETEKEYEVTVELPGMKPEEFNVEFKEGALWLSGHREEEKEEKEKTFHRVERRYGEFRRIIPLPGAVNEEKADASFKEGVLKVIIPKAEEAKPRRVEVKT
jgi:HSP20 family protein